MTWYEQLFGVLAMITCVMFIPVGLLAISTCMLSSSISQQEEKRVKKNICDMEGDELAMVEWHQEHG